jgi:hypothetical protein
MSAFAVRFASTGDSGTRPTSSSSSDGAATTLFAATVGSTPVNGSLLVAPARARLDARPLPSEAGGAEIRRTSC